MTDFDKIFWGFVFSATGIGFGWTLNQAGQWFRSRQEDKKHLKIVLFNLLETYFLFMRSDVDRIIQLVTDKIFEKIPKEQQTVEAKQVVKGLYQDIVSTHLKPELMAESKRIAQGYQESIKALAGIDPLIAYYLSGKATNVMEGFDRIQDLFDGLKQTYPSDAEAIDKGTKQVIEIMKPDIFTGISKDLENDILDISWEIGITMWFRSKRVISRIKKNVTEKVDSQIDDYLNKVTSILA